MKIKNIELIVKAPPNEFLRCMVCQTEFPTLCMTIEDGLLDVNVCVCSRCAWLSLERILKQMR